MTATDVRFENCYSSTKGGAIALWTRSMATLTRVTVKDSSAAVSGGGIYAHSDVTFWMTTSIIDGTTANYGGGLLVGRGSDGVLKGGSRIRRCSASTAGGAMIATLSTLTLKENAVIEESHAASVGGAVALASGSILEMADSTFSDNSAGGGGDVFMFADGAAFYGVRSLFRGGHASLTGGGSIMAYAISCVRVPCIDLVLEDVVVANTTSGSAALDGAGAFYLTRTNALLKNVTFFKTHAYATAGAIHLTESSIATIEDSSFEDCYGLVGGGGAMTVLRSHVRIKESTFLRCHAHTVGGALFIEAGAQVLFLDSEISECGTTEGPGGGIFVERGGSLRVHGVLMTNNVAGTSGGAIANEGDIFVVGPASFEENLAFDDGGSIFSNGTAAHTAISANCEFMKFILDWTSDEATQPDDAFAWLIHVDSHNVGERFTDIRGRFIQRTPYRSKGSRSICV